MEKKRSARNKKMLASHYYSAMTPTLVIYPVIPGINLYN